MPVLIVANSAPCGCEGPCNGFRLVADDCVFGVHAQTTHDLAAATARSGKVVFF